MLGNEINVYEIVVWYCTWSAQIFKGSIDYVNHNIKNQGKIEIAYLGEKIEKGFLRCIKSHNQYF